MNWKWGTAFGIMVFITLISIVFALVQQTVAEASRREAELQFDMANTCREEAEAQRKIAEKSTAIALASEQEARKQQSLAESLNTQLEKCRGRKVTR
jgi:uncharacterized membrane protein YhiD involved in acid resistance